MAKDKSSSKGGSKPRRRKGDRSPKRPPVATIFVLVLFLLSVLTFITLRQQQSTEDQKLRLLAGLANQVETALPDRAQRMLDVIRGQCDHTAVKSFLDQLPDLQLVSPQTAGDERYGPRILATGGTTYLEYAGPAYLGEAVPTCSKESADGSGQTPSEPAGGHFLAELDLSSILAPIIIPEAFDALLIAGDRGEVLFQRGSRELQLTDISSLVGQVESGRSLLGWLPGTGGDGDGDETAEPAGSHTVVDSVHLANSDYRLFLQPVRVTLPAVRGEAVPPAVRWTAIGLVSEERLLSSSFTTSPLLLFLLVAVFPAALVSWPFLKLRYIGPRQRFHRLDAVALVFATLFGTSLATFVLLDGLFISRLTVEIDGQLETLSGELRTHFHDELIHAHRQLTAATDHYGETVEALRAAKTASNGTPIEGETSLTTLAEVEVAVERLFLDDGHPVPLIYPYFHSLFWIDENGRQHHKLSLRRYALLRNAVAERPYFTRIYDRVSKQVASRFPHRGEERFELHHGTKVIQASFSALRSMTSGDDLLVVSVPFEGRLPSGAAANDGEKPLALPVAVLYGKPISVGFPVLPEGYGFAIVEPDGRVLFHSDSRRSLNENFLKASDRSALLTSLFESRREAHLVADYWGQRNRLFVAPLNELPWSLVVFRQSRDLRLRNFELIYDFLNPFLLYTLTLNLIVLTFIVVRPRRLAKFLWPGIRFRTAYRVLKLTCITAILLTALVATAVDKGWFSVQCLVWVAVLEPFAILLLGGFWLSLADPLNRWAESHSGRLSRWERRLAWMASGLAIPVALPWIFWWRDGPAPSVVPAVLLVAAVYWIVGWGKRRHSFRGRRRMKAYIATLACLIFVLAVLPAALLFEAAASRQAQLLVQETQIDQAAALQRHDEKLLDAMEIDSTEFFATYGPTVEQLKRSYLESIFATRLLDPEAADGEPTGAATSSGSRRWRSAWPDECGDTGDGVQRGLAQRLVAARPFPLNDLSGSATGVDLSRYPRHGCGWTAVLGRGEDRPWLTGRLDGIWGKSFELRSTLFEPLSLEGMSLLCIVGFLLAYGLAFALPWWLSRTIARKVLLVPLASVERGRMRDILTDATEAAASNEARPVAGRKVLLVTSVPDLALDSLVEQTLAEDDGEPFVINTLQQVVDRWKSTRGATSAEDAAGDEEPARASAPRSPVQERREARRGDHKPVLLVRFDPCLNDSKVAYNQIDALKYVSETQGRTLVILSRWSIHALREEAEAAQRRGDRTVESALLRRWIAFLASFVVRYGRDAVLERDRLFTDKIREVDEQLKAEDDPMPEELRDHQRLLQLIYDDCSITRHLQEIGLQVVDEIDWQSATDEQVLNQIAFLARPYYSAIWENCSTDEKVVLSQLALDGLVNPDNLSWVLDLMQKGLIQREPERRKKSPQDGPEQVMSTDLNLERPQGRWRRRIDRLAGRFPRFRAVVDAWPNAPVPSTALRLMNRSFARFVRQQVERAQLLEWEEEEGTSTWSVLRWLLPIPLLLLGGFLFITQRDAVSNMIGVLVAVASLTPTLITLFDHFRHMADRRAIEERRPAGG